MAFLLCKVVDDEGSFPRHPGLEEHRQRKAVKPPKVVNPTTSSQTQTCDLAETIGHCYQSDVREWDNMMCCCLSFSLTGGQACVNAIDFFDCHMPRH